MLMKSRPVVAIVDEVAGLPAVKQIQFVRLWVWRLRESSGGDLINDILKAVGRYARVRGKDSKSIEDWMEARLVEDFSINPRRLAYEYRFYKQVSLGMEPHLYAVAKRVKKRLETRRARVGRLSRWPRPAARRTVKSPAPAVPRSRS